MKKGIINIVLSTMLYTNMAAQTVDNKTLLYSNRFSVLAGLIQPLLLKGGNVELNYFIKSMSFDYSHGFSLDPPASSTFRDHNILLHLPYSTGFGVGYRVTSFFDIRIEPKLHSWKAYHKGESQAEANKLADFKTFTLGIGLYYRYFPFKNSASKALQGITTSTSIRWWHNMGSTLSKDAFSYVDKASGKTASLKAPNIGISNTPLIFNIAVGYTFGGK